MKKRTILLMLLSFSLAGNSQEAVKTEKKTERITLVNGGESSQTVEKREKLTPEQQIANCKKQLAALDKKEAFIRSNPEELKIANETNWFENADKARMSIEKKMQELKLQLKK
jgi:hypothetical protein